MNPSGKHHYKVHSYLTGEAVVLQCQNGLCTKFYVMSHEQVVKLVAA